MAISQIILRVFSLEQLDGFCNVCWERRRSEYESQRWSLGFLRVCSTSLKVCHWTSWGLAMKVPEGFPALSWGFVTTFLRVVQKFPEGFRAPSWGFLTTFLRVCEHFPEGFPPLSWGFLRVSEHFPEGSWLAVLWNICLTLTLHEVSLLMVGSIHSLVQFKLNWLNVSVSCSIWTQLT